MMVVTSNVSAVPSRYIGFWITQRSRKWWPPILFVLIECASLQLRRTIQFFVLWYFTIPPTNKTVEARSITLLLV